MVSERSRTMNACTSLLVAAAALQFSASMACKINRDGNCLNPKASCYNKDKEAPSIANTTPTTTPRNPILSSIVFSFAEPMKNADVKENYLPMTGDLGSLQLQSASRINDQTYQLSLTGTPAFGNVTFNLSKLEDLAGNRLATPFITFETGTIGAIPDTVTSSGGYTETNVFWSNTTPDAMTYLIKKNGTDCASATAVTGTNVSGTVMSNGAVVTNLGFAQFTAPGPDIIRVCLTPVSTGSATSFTTNVYRDDSVPTLSTVTSGRVKIPYAITLTCNDNVDRIVYTIDGSNPGFNITTSGSNIGATITNNSFVYSIANGYSLTQRGAVTFKHLCIDKAGHLSGAVLSATLQSKFVWDESTWNASAPPQPYDTWD